MLSIKEDHDEAMDRSLEVEKRQRLEQLVGGGTAKLFMMVEPLGGWRHVNVTTHRTKTDCADQVRELVDVHCPKARRITLVMDNLSTHRLSSLYEAVEPAEARRLIDKMEPVHTPKHVRG